MSLVQKFLALIVAMVAVGLVGQALTGVDGHAGTMTAEAIVLVAGIVWIWRTKRVGP